MPRKPTGKPVGRPQKPIDWTQFEQLCALQCTQSEIASMLHISVETLSQRSKSNYGDDYLEIYKRFQESGNCSLRRNQFVISKKNASMAIWLGKIWLGQTDPGFDQTKESLTNVVIETVREIAAESRIEATQRSLLENQQSLLDQKFRGDTTEIQAELGTKNIMGGNA